MVIIEHHNEEEHQASNSRLAAPVEQEQTIPASQTEVANK